MLTVETQFFLDDRESIVIRTVEVEFGVSVEEEEREEGEEREVGFSGHWRGLAPAGSGGVWWWELKIWLVVSYINWDWLWNEGLRTKLYARWDRLEPNFLFHVLGLRI